MPPLTSRNALTIRLTIPPRVGVDRQWHRQVRIGLLTRANVPRLTVLTVLTIRPGLLRTMTPGRRRGSDGWTATTPWSTAPMTMASTSWSMTRRWRCEGEAAPPGPVAERVAVVGADDR